MRKNYERRGEAIIQPVPKELGYTVIDFDSEETFEDWQSLDAFEPRRQVAREILIDGELSVSGSSGSL